MKIGEAWMELRLKSDKAEKDADDAGKKLSSKLLGYFSSAVFIAGMKKSVDAASNLNEEITKSQTIFGKGSSAVIEFSKTAAKSMGISERAYLSAASNLKGMLDNMGLADDKSTQWSQKLVALGGDLASFFNTQPADAIQAISAALRGESEPIRRYNVSLNDALLKNKALELGLYDGKGALDANARANAALAVIMDQTSAAQGDFAKTSSGLANTQRITAAEQENASASLGKSFLPIYQRINQVVGETAHIFGELPTPIQLAIVALVGLAAMSGPLTSLIALAGTLKTALAAMELGAAFAAALPWVLALSAAVLAGLIVWSVFFEEVSKGNKTVDALNKSVKSAASGLDAQRVGLMSAAAAAKLYNKELFGDVEAKTRARLSANSALVKGMLAYGITMDEAVKAEHDATKATELRLKVAAMDAAGTVVLTDAMKAQGITQEDLEASAKAYREELAVQLIVAEAATDALVLQALAGDTVAIVALKASGSWDRLTAAQQAAANTALANVPKIDAATKAEDEHAAAVLNAADSSTIAKKASEDLTAALEETSAIFGEAAAAADSLRTAIDEVFAPAQDLEAANVAIAAASDALIKSLKENGVTLDIHTEKGRSNRAAIKDSADAIIEQAAALVENNTSLEEANGAIAWNTELLIQQLVKFGMTRTAAEDYIKTIGLTPENISTAIAVAGDNVARTKIKKLMEQLGPLEDGVTAEIGVKVAAGDFAGAEAQLQAMLDEQRVAKISTAVDNGEFDAVRALLQGFADEPTIKKIEADIERGDLDAIDADLEAFLEKKRLATIEVVPTDDSMDEIAALMTKLGVIDKGVTAEIYAEIAAGDLTAAQAKLQLLLDEKNVAKIGVDLKDGELEKAKSLLGEIVDAPLAASITADIDDGNFAAANKKLKDFIEEKRKAVALDVKIGKATGGVTLGTTSRAYSLLELKAFALGGFIPYGSGSDQGLPQGTTPALLHPNEAVIPLSNPTRIQQLFADPRISGPIEDALGPLDPLYGRGPTAADPGNWAVIASAQETKQKRDELYAVRDREMLDDLLKPVKGKAPDYWKAANTLQKAVDLRDALFAKKDAARAGELNKRKAARDALSAKSDQEEMDRLKAATDTTVDPNYWGAIATFSAHIAARDNLYAEKYDQELVNAQKFKIAAAEMAASQRANSQDNVGGTGVSRSSPSSSTPGYSSSSYSGKPAVQQHTHTWHVYGAERAFIMDIMREMDLIGREYK
ncbi:hypothetical protein UFOVP1519_45 [uncultured Caudovirales phage]|uniref:Uncharacterized protein n=1 Tax=uncultured Caudovirales phage TaxID=2100421 RepID=A0A6J5RKS0_9CAUD|nr:hypothetical protein UFOVP1306_19 [uncultured Caudovirales phage]CAB4210247.1 hypothetical protein UFOVP1422_21 [uncultured Caudovirales phage]CAB5227447.1 hypothetical protein UFOVP1519_45 [uncultured Caudovirales phage]